MELEIQHKARKFVLRLEEGDAQRSVLWLKEYLCSRQDIPTTAENVRLFYKGKQLHDSISLRASGLKGPRAKILLISHAAASTAPDARAVATSTKDPQNVADALAEASASSLGRTKSKPGSSHDVIICGSTEHTFYVEVRYKHLWFHVHPLNTEAPSIGSVKRTLAGLCRDRDGRGQCTPLCDELGVHVRPSHLRLLCKGREPADDVLLQTLGICEPGTKIMMLVSNKGHSIKSNVEERIDMEAELTALGEQLVKLARQSEHRLVDPADALVQLGRAKDTLASAHAKLQAWLEKFANDEEGVIVFQRLLLLHADLNARVEHVSGMMKCE